MSCFMPFFKLIVAVDRQEQRCGSSLDFPGDVYHPDFLHGKLAYFDVTVHNPLQDYLWVSQQCQLALLYQG